MPSRRKRQGKQKKRSFLKRWLFLLLFLVILLAGLYWYVQQPLASWNELKRILHAYLSHGRDISISETTGDIYHLYYGSAVSSSYTPDDSSSVFGGIPTRTNGTSLQLLVNTGYCVGYDELMRLPAWAAYRLFDVPSPVLPERPTAFLPDLRTAKPVHSEEYTGSGFDRGHLAPNFSIARCYGEEAQHDTFLLSNVIPQRHTLNAGPWKALELREATNYTGRFEKIWVMAGPVFGDEIHCLPSGIPIPEQLFKIIVQMRNGNIRILAIMMPQDCPEEKDFQKYLCSVDEIETKTSLDFFPELTWEEQNALESKPAPSIW